MFFSQSALNHVSRICSRCFESFDSSLIAQIISSELDLTCLFKATVINKREEMLTWVTMWT